MARALERADCAEQARYDIAQGERLFNDRQFVISDVGGFNELPAAPCWAPAPHVTTRRTWANHSVERYFDLGSHRRVAPASHLPLYTLRNKTTGGDRSRPPIRGARW